MEVKEKQKNKDLKEEKKEILVELLMERYKKIWETEIKRS